MTIQAEEIRLNTYFAVQTMQGENTHDVAAMVCKMAKEVSVLFRRIEVLDTFTLGSKVYVRLRSDVVNTKPIFDKLLAQGRGVVLKLPTGGYALRRMEGRDGPVSVTLLHGEVKPGMQRMYRGPKMVGWLSQFEPAAA